VDGDAAAVAPQIEGFDGAEMFYDSGEHGQCVVRRTV
jgi:hypothetical protein